MATWGRRMQRLSAILAEIIRMNERIRKLEIRHPKWFDFFDLRVVLPNLLPIFGCITLISSPL